MKSFRLLLLVGALLAPATADTFYLTVAGLGGEPDYEARFGAQAADLHKLFAASPGARPELFSGKDATKAALQASLKKLAAEAKPDDVLVLTLIGHGSFDGIDYKFNLPGPDLSAAELRAMLDAVPARQLVVNASSSSGGSINLLKREGRVLITATRSGGERLATVFGRYWVEALRDANADTDKNDIISALEAFRYADQRTTEFYKSQNRLATEHALLEDTGAGEGVRAPSPENKQGLLAGRLAVLRLGAAQAAFATPAKRKLLERKEELEREIDQLKYQKAAMPSDEYRRSLSKLLLELARTQEELDK